MIEHLAALIETFPGTANQTCCFAHILNLVAKSVLRQFEAPKKGKVVDVEIAADVDDMDVDASDKGSNESSDECDDGEDDDDDDDEEGLPDELDALSMEEMTRLKDSVKPIRLVLTKVS